MVGTPTAPIHKTSSVPIARTAVCNVPMRGVDFNVYPVFSNISRSSGQSFVADVAVDGCGVGGALNNFGVSAMFNRGGRDNIGSGVDTGAKFGVVVCCCVCAGWGMGCGAGWACV